MRVLARVLVRDDLAERPRRAHQHRAALRVQCDVVDDRSRGDEAHRHDVARLDRDRPEHAQRKRRCRRRLRLHYVRILGLLLESLAPQLLRVDEPGHEPVRYALPEGLDDVARTEVVWGKDVAPDLAPREVRVAVLDEGDVCGATGVVLDAHDVAWAGLVTHEVYDTYTLLVAPANEPNSYVSMVIPAAAFSERNGEFAEGSALVEVGG